MAGMHLLTYRRRVKRVKKGKKKRTSLLIGTSVFPRMHLVMSINQTGALNHSMKNLYNRESLSAVQKSIYQTMSENTGT